ncbi:bile acid:sodium symporter family protein [Egbenema bharatensis]|uniref:bile acid:sodium symporter family protein n=1 Tax=Egbenema bharatensis TaxID=3463334 RepID=UPI003A85ACDF
MAEILQTLSNLFTLTFVVTSMFSMGLTLTVPQILNSLRNQRLVILALLVNFGVVPIAAVILSRVIPLSLEHQIGLILLAAAAGAPFLPKLAQIAKGNVPFSVGLMTLLVITTVIYLPLVLPLLLPGVEVNAFSIAITLILEILVPLVIGLLINARYQDTAVAILHPFTQISNVSLALLLVLMLGLNLGNVLGLFGSGAIFAIALLVVIATAVGYFLGGSGSDARKVLALGTGQRNMAAAFTVATGNFSDRPDVLVFLAAAGLVGMMIVMPVAAEFGKRARREREKVQAL